MARFPRTQLPDGFFHVWARGVAARVVLPQAEDRTEMFRLIGLAAHAFGWQLYAACVMSTHYHLVLDVGVEDLSAGMHQLNWRYARYYNEKYELFGHVFAERFKSRAILDGEESVFDVCAYVLQNPVKARLCLRAEEWPWSYSRYGLERS